MSEMRGGGGGIDPSNLHLRKELTQIRKATRALRDPGTTSSWRSPLSSARSAAATVAVAANVASSSTNYHKNQSIHHKYANGGEHSESKGKERKVFLYNWRNQRSSSEKSVATARSGEKRRNPEREEDDEEEEEIADSSSSVPEESVEESLSDARNGGESKCESCIADRYASMIFKCKGTNLAPSIRRAAIKKKPNRNTHLANVLRQQIVQSRNSKQALESLHSLSALGLGRDDSESLIDQSEDTEEFNFSEDVRRISAASPLLSRLKTKNFLRNSRKEDSSYSTPALSTSSYNRYVNRNPSTVGSWDATTVSFNGGDDEVDDQLDLLHRQGCGIPCYWSKRATPKHRGTCGSGSCYSPSLSETLRRKGREILCGSQTMYYRHRRGSSCGSKKRGVVSRTAQGVVPLLTNSCDGSGHSDDELSTNFGELDLEALSGLDGRRWSCSCRSQDGLELVAQTGEGEEGSTLENIGSLSQKYRPMFFEELIGQNIVVQSLMNAISRGRIAPVYLFQGPRGTGKTSTARIFAAALNCLATEETKPCGVCRECADFISGKVRDLREVDSSSKKGIDRARHVLKNFPVRPSSAFSRYQIFIIDECRLLPSKMWMAFLKFLEQPPPRVVFIFMTTDLDNVPRTVLSRCQKYLFNKIRDSDIVARLRKISADENLDVESDALDLIALNADGSLRDAETMLDQLSLLGKRITTFLVNELVGVVSDEKLLDLLELAMSSETAETVKRARELMDSGVDPMVVMSQLATLIMDIIAGTYQVIESKYGDSLLNGRNLNESELDKLKQALKLLSEAEKQLRVSSERSTWFTATLLQLGSVASSDATQSGSSRRQSSKTTEGDPSSASREAHFPPRKSTSPISLPKSAIQNLPNQEDPFLLTNAINTNSKHTQSRFISGGPSDKLDDIWVRCIERCHSKTLRQLLLTYGKLISISEVEGLFIAYVAFGDKDVKTRAERFLSSITNSFETVLQYNVEVRIILLPDGEISINSGKTVTLPDSLGRKQIDKTEVINRERKAICSNSMGGYSDLDLRQEPLKVLRGNFDGSEGKLRGTVQTAAGSPIPLAEGNTKMGVIKERIPMQRIESIIREHRLETAWLQAVEKGTPGSLSHLKPEKNQILPQEGIYPQNQTKSTNSVDLSSQCWEDELNHEIKVLKINDGKAAQMDQIGKRIDHCPISPSLLHDSSFMGNFSKESMGYESGSGAGGCSGLFCWNNGKPHRRAKDKQGTPVRLRKGARFAWFGECAKAKSNRFRR
ncbi:Protein STICHEL like [Actinidia chinensis var. chinensis]|uniref:Protein STICHEL like n=1 Tax=Actinidia chinensis var. chinensis TaxID=1590841 RepID=A0A2R6RGH4_ACTCC|nr:Protein STICHEL like [Actinidia chinensis var. chinensis]